MHYVDIITEAQTWIGTPYHHGQRQRSLGTDCIGLLLGVAMATGRLPASYPVPTYSPQWHWHQEREMLVDAIQAAGCPQLEMPMPGCILLFREHRAIGHCGILLDMGTFVHAHAQVGGGGAVRVARYAGVWARQYAGAYGWPMKAQT